MHFVDHDEAQVAEQPGNIGVAVQQQRFEGFRRDLENAGGVAEQSVLMGLRDIAVPVPDRNFRLPAEVVEPLELVVDERFQWTDVEGADRTGRILEEEGQNREEGRFRLAGGGGGGEQEVGVGVKDRVTCGDLDCAQRLPAVAVDELPDERGVALKDLHSIFSG